MFLCSCFNQKQLKMPSYSPPLREVKVGLTAISHIISSDQGTPFPAKEIHQEPGCSLNSLHLLRNGATHNGLGPPASMNNQSSYHRYAQGPMRSRQFHYWGSPLIGLQGVARWVLKLTGTCEHEISMPEQLISQGNLFGKNACFII